MNLKIAYVFEIKIFSMLFSYPASQFNFIRARTLFVLFYAISLVGLPATEKLVLNCLLNELTCSAFK